MLGNTRKFAVLGVLLSAVMILGACAPAAAPAPTSAPPPTEAPTSAPPPTEAPTAMPAATPPTTGGQGPTVSMAHNDQLGDILTDSRGMTLYTFKNDQPDTSNCSSTCAQNWPPLTVASMDTTPTADSGITAKLGVISRQDGTYQVTANNMPLYYYKNDAAAGDTKGQGVGNLWYVVSPAGEMMTGSASGQQ